MWFQLVSSSLSLSKTQGAIAKEGTASSYGKWAKCDITKKPAINKYAFLWSVHIIAAGTGPKISLFAKTHQLVKTMVFRGLLVWLIISGYEIVSLFTFAISFDWYSSKSLLQWWSYELLNLLRRKMLFFIVRMASQSQNHMFFNQ